MSGPPYPPPPTPGGNAIGLFEIGVSPIGAVPEFNPWAPIISQYKNSNGIDSLALSIGAAFDQTENFSNLYDNIWNVLTAVGYGLDVWGRIVGVIRTIFIPATISYIGFEEAGSSWTGFGQGGFFSGGLLTQNFVLDDADFKRLILAKAASNISNGSIPAVNAILLALFPSRGACYVVDNLNMTVTYVFHFALTPVELAIVSQLNVLPTSTGVSITIQQT